MQIGARGRRRRRRRRITATTAVLVVLAAAVGVGVWRTQFDGSASRHTKTPSATDANATVARLSATDAIANPCRALTLTDARKLLGSAAVNDSDGSASSGGCTYSTAPRTPVSGVAVDMAERPSLSVQLWRGQLPLDTSTSTTCPDCLPHTVRPVAGIGDRAAWYQRSSYYQTGAFPDGNLDVQVGGTAIRITVAATENAETVAESAARVVVPRLVG